MSVQGESTSRMPIGRRALVAAAVPGRAPLRAGRRPPWGRPGAADGFGPALPGGRHHLHLRLRVRRAARCCEARCGGVTARRRTAGGARHLAGDAAALLHDRQPLDVARRPRPRRPPRSCWPGCGRARPTTGGAWLLTGLLGGLVCVVRPQDAVLLALPLLDLLRRGRGARRTRCPRFLAGPRGARAAAAGRLAARCTGSRSRT